MGPRKGVASVVRRFSRPDTFDRVPNFDTITKALCAQNSAWRGEFSKCAKGSRRCPPHLRARLRACLARETEVAFGDDRSTFSDVIRQSRTAAATHEIVIRDRSELGLGQEYRILVAKLADARQQGEFVDVVIRVEADHVDVHGLGLLAAWCERYAARVQFKSTSTRVNHYLESTGCKDVLERRVGIDEVHYDAHNHVAITRIDREHKQKADQVAGRIVELFERHISRVQSIRSPLNTMFAELVENVYRHAESNYPAIVLAQAYPRYNRLHVVVADTGIGIFDSFRKSRDDRLREHCRTPELALDRALEKLVTSKSERHGGYGLFVVKRLAQLNGGIMRIMSGQVTKKLSKVIRRGRTNDVEEKFSHKHWHGTEVSLMFHLDRPLPLKEVYEELGTLDRQEDFFD